MLCDQQSSHTTFANIVFSSRRFSMPLCPGMLRTVVLTFSVAYTTGCSETHVLAIYRPTLSGGKEEHYIVNNLQNESILWIVISETFK